jgi:3-oxoacyl-[acyl-carrier-protein] synthase II
LHEAWTAAKAGISGIVPITRFDVSGSKWKVGGELKGFDGGRYLSRKEMTRLDPFVHYAVAAAMMAAEDAGLIPLHSPHATHQPLLETAGVIMGSSRGGISTIEKELQKMYSSCFTPHVSRTSAYLMPSTTISMGSSYVAQKLGIKGYCLGISNACASGTTAIGEAYRLIKSGCGNLVFCGGAEAPLCRICMEGYGATGALSMGYDSSASRPFDNARDGFVLSEGACVLVLEAYERALERDARVYGEIIGYGNSTDAYHQTIPSAKGEARAMKGAMDEAELNPRDIHFISSHGTSTPLGDKTETEAIKLFFGRDASRIPITALKSMTGHMLAASGALETAFVLMGMAEGLITPTINLRERDPECDLDYVTALRHAEIGYSMAQSFGFGGLNAVLIFRRLDS